MREYTPTLNKIFINLKSTRFATIPKYVEKYSVGYRERNRTCNNNNNNEIIKI